MTLFHDLKELIKMPILFFQRATRLTYASLGIAAVIGFFYFMIIFRKRDGSNEFGNGLSEGTEYQWFRVKLMLLLMICGGSYLLAYHQLPDWFPIWFQRG